MRLLKRLTDSDILGGTPVLMESISRYGSRGVLVNNEFNIAMMFMSKLNLYKLPGGGVEEGENKVEAFLREIREETGCEADITYELGYIEEHKNKNQYMQFSYCFIARVIRYTDSAALSENEINLGMEVKWMSLDKALEIMNNSVQDCGEYSTKFMLLRDKTILEEVVSVLNKTPNMIVDKASIEDVDSICDLDHLVTGNRRRGKYLLKSIENDDSVVARMNRTIVGYAIYDCSFFGYSYIHLVIVSPQFRRKGVANGLIDFIEKNSRTDKLFTSTNESNITMQKVCESLGYIRSGIIENLDDGDPELIYYKLVDSVH